MEFGLALGVLAAQLKLLVVMCQHTTNYSGAQCLSLLCSIMTQLLSGRASASSATLPDALPLRMLLLPKREEQSLLQLQR